MRYYIDEKLIDWTSHNILKNHKELIFGYIKMYPENISFINQDKIKMSLDKYNYYCLTDKAYNILEMMGEPIVSTKFGYYWCFENDNFIGYLKSRIYEFKKAYEDNSIEEGKFKTFYL